MIDNPQAPITPQIDLPPRAQPPPDARQNNKEGVRTILSTIAVLLIAPAVALVLTLFVFQSYQVDGPSMETTLSNNDRLIVWKMPRTWARITGHHYIPQRGDVIVFVAQNLNEFGQEPNKQLIKRVVGLPGEKVAVHDGVLTVYNKTHPEGFRPDATLPYGKAIPTTNGDNEWTVGADEVFVCGDNRPNSLDSRSFGPIQTQDIVGKLILRILPLGDAERF
ncbi:MAG TPA: signal peptidase I [Nevskiaceae bacterium]|nr:signal peptidase I [Nevskiaceae bacterium]